MKQRLLESTSLCVVLLFSSVSVAQVRVPPRSPAGGSIEHLLIDLQKAFVNAKERGDADYVRNAIADDFASIETNGSTEDKSDFLRDIHPPDEPGPPPILYHFKVLFLNEGSAVVTYCAVFPESEVEKYQHVSDTWAKQANGWRLKFEQSTLNLWSANDMD